MTKFELLIFFHILGAFLITGGAGVGVAAGVAMGQTMSVRAIGLLSVIAHRAAFIVTLPGSLIVLATGTWLIADYEAFEINQLWLWSAYVLWLVAAALDHGILGPFLKQLHLRANRLEAAGTIESVELKTAAGAAVGQIVGTVLIVLTLASLYMMVFRPGS